MLRVAGFDFILRIAEGTEACDCWSIHVRHIDRGKAGVGRWFARERLMANTIFLTLVVLNVIFIIIGTFFRGPNWSFVSPF